MKRRHDEIERVADSAIGLENWGRGSAGTLRIVAVVDWEVDGGARDR